MSRLKNVKWKDAMRIASVGYPNTPLLFPFRNDMILLYWTIDQHQYGIMIMLISPAMLPDPYASLSSFEPWSATLSSVYQKKATVQGFCSWVQLSVHGTTHSHFSATICSSTHASVTCEDDEVEEAGIVGTDTDRHRVSQETASRKRSGRKGHGRRKLQSAHAAARGSSTDSVGVDTSVIVVARFVCTVLSKERSARLTKEFGCSVWLLRKE